MPKKYYSTPIGIAVPIVFLGYAIFFSVLFFHELGKGHVEKTSDLLFWVFTIMGCILVSIILTRILCRYVLLYPDHIVCRGLFSQKIVMDYSKCYVGVDYGNHQNGKTWWIYLSYEPYPPFKKGAYYNRINAQYCKQGFIRTMYRDEVYQALMEVLPKKQRTMLGASYSLHLSRYED